MVHKSTWTHGYQIVCQPEDEANPSSWAKLQAFVNWGLNLAHLRDCRALWSTQCLSMRKSWVRGSNEAEGGGTRGSSVTIVGEQSDIKSYQPFTSYPPLSSFSYLPTLVFILQNKSCAANLKWGIFGVESSRWQLLKEWLREASPHRSDWIFVKRGGIIYNPKII